MLGSASGNQECERIGRKSTWPHARSEKTGRAGRHLH